MKKDFVIVGSGAGGATLARELAKNGKDVAIVEWGKDNPPYGSKFVNPLRFFGGFKHKSKAILQSSGEPRMDIVRCITTGGSTMAYGGVSWDPPYELFLKYNIELEQYVEEIKKEICIMPLKENQLGEGAKKIKKSADALGYDWNFLDRFFANPRNFRQCSYLFGDKTGARWDARMWALEAVSNGAELLNESFCEQLLIKDGKATGILLTDKNNKKITLAADKVILAAGGIGSPKLLKQAGIDAGKDIFVDPYFLAIGYLDKEFAKPEVTRQAGVLLKDQGLSLGDSALPVQAYRRIAMKNKKLGKIFSQKKALSLLVEIDDSLNGSVDSDYEIKKSLTKEDFEKLEKGKVIARKILENAGAKDIWFTDVAGVHPGGTCKIGEVVDSDLKTDIEGLYVCDASVLPESMAIPPALTIMSLAKRLAEHIL